MLKQAEYLLAPPVAQDSNADPAVAAADADPVALTLGTAVSTAQGTQVPITLTVDPA